MSLHSARRTARVCCAGVLLACIGTASAAPPKIISTLEGFNEGWRVGSLPLQHTAQPPGSHPATYDEDFGDPKGSLRVLDEARETAVFAPVDFLGDKRAYLGGRIRYGVVVRASDETNYGEAVLRSEAQSLFYVGDTIPQVSFSNEFEYRTLPLGKKGWRVGSFDGPPATYEQMKAVLSALTGVYIRTEWKTGPDDTSVDTISMSNGEPASEVAFTQATYSRSEGAASVRLELARTGTFDGPASVDIAAAGGTATLNQDYAPVAGTVSWPTGVGGTRSVVVDLKNDLLDERTETLVVGLTNAQNANLGEQDTATVRILDDDPSPIVSVDSNDKSAAEGTATGTTTKFRVVLNTASGQTIRAPFTVQYGTASGGDFASITPSPLVFTPGKLSQEIVVVTRPDATPEGNETVTFQLGLPDNALLGADSAATLTVTNDD